MDKRKKEERTGASKLKSQAAVLRLLEDARRLDVDERFLTSVGFVVLGEEEGILKEGKASAGALPHRIARAHLDDKTQPAVKVETSE